MSKSDDDKDGNCFIGGLLLLFVILPVGAVTVTAAVSGCYWLVKLTFFN